MKNKQKHLLCGLIALHFFFNVEAQATLKVMTFNKLFTTSNSATLNVIQSSGADIIGMQESFGAGQSVANSLGFYYHSNSNSEVIFSRYPISSTNSSGIQVTLPSGLEVYVFNAHLPSYPYGPYDIRDGDINSESQAISSSNNIRSNEMIAMVNTIQSWVPSGAPVFFTGDFNEPSHLDWTQEAVNAQIHAMKVEWPTSQRATDIGLKDSWRTLFPDEVSNPGNTWTPNISSNEVYDRIDIIYHRGDDVSATQAVRYGPTGDEAELTLNGYASDHRTVMITYSIPEPNTGGGQVNYGSNLLEQNSAEQSNLDNWIQVSGTNKRIEGGQNGYPSAKSGNYIFWLGNAKTGELYQDINVAQYAGNIDTGKQSFLFNGFVRTYNGTDKSQIKVEYRDNSNNVLETFDTGLRDNSGSWAEINDERTAPSGTRTVRVILLSQRGGYWGNSNDGYFDDLSLKTGTNTNSNARTTISHKSKDFLEKDLKCEIWPNPVKDYINFNLNKEIGGEISIIDITGQTMKKIQVSPKSNFRIATYDISEGFYILQFIDEKGVSYKQRIIVE